MGKEKSLDELNKVKDSVGIQTSKIDKGFYRIVNFDCQYIIDLIKQYPNNQKLGDEIRKYYESLKG